MLTSFRLNWLSFENPRFEAYTFLPSPKDGLEFVDGFYMNWLAGTDLFYESLGVYAIPHRTPGHLILDKVDIPPARYLAQGAGLAPDATDFVRAGDFVFVTDNHGPSALHEARTLVVRERLEIPYEPPYIVPPVFTAPVIPFDRAKKRQQATAIKTANP